MKRFLRPVPLALAVLLLVALVFLGGRWLLGPKVAAVEVTRGDLVQTVVSTGRVITPARVELGAVVTGTVGKIAVTEGNPVKAGETIATLRDDEQRAALAQARAALAEAEARVRQLTTVSTPVADQNLRAAEATLQLNRAEFERVKQLYEKGFYGKARLDEATRNLQTAEAQYRSGVAQAQTNRPEGSDYALALARRDQARAAVDVAQAKLDNMHVKAPADGTLLVKLVEPGDVVQAGKKMFEMAVAGDTQLVLNVDEKNLALLASGQKAKAVADAYPGQPFDAQVFYIAPSVDAQRGTVEVKLRVPRPPAFLRPDLTVSAEIVGARRDGTVIVPTEAIRDAATTAPYALVVREGRVVRQPVKLGLRGDGKTEVLEGVVPGEAVVPSAQSTIAVGQRVRVETTPVVKPPPAKGETFIR
ncbi:MAG: efflux RND transporter periplasmic adaptor subunit [Burkholderiales bacterium]|jgi:HlyD family secretion protein|nr:efflux RND transporter periplasmic adaptor subunit [Burkholderiales bacterium]